MKTEVIVFNYSHYSMDNNKGLSVRVLGEPQESNNGAGVQISDATVTNYDEVEYLKRLPKEKFPAKFKATIGFTTIKNRSGAEKAGIALSNLEYVNSLTLVDAK